MTIGTAALIQNLKSTAKPEGRQEPEGNDAKGGDGDNAFLDLLQSMKNGGGSASQQAVSSETGAATAGNLSPEDVLAATKSGEGATGQEAGTAAQSFANDLAKVIGTVAPKNPEALVLPQQNNNMPAAATTPQNQPDTAQRPQTTTPASGVVPPVANAVSTAAMPLSSAAPKPQNADRLFSQFAVPEEAAANKGAIEGLGERISKSGKISAEGTSLPAGSVKILRQETHFAPTQRLSPIQQIGERLIFSLGEAAEAGGIGTRAAAVKTEGPVLKTLDIQLTPIELGTVKVSLRLVGESVEVTVKTSNPQTAELLKQDRQMLDQMLRATGYKPDAITIQAAADDRPITSSQPGQQTGGSTQGEASSGGQAFDGASGRESEHGQRSSGSSSGDGEAVPMDANSGGVRDEDDASDRRNGDIYL
ncbi:flagellar hook-length control protein FliK [Roseibium polysiphoniae]|uniref:Flagellar hook-length control protein FliK n=1 Tax=Roseibium polysiphoniae TaxID=2571221 RepID=A0ABR9CBT6_9HYPH|nr:flagellar hook-length control protein FliK [Roseibium polysiphoniae]MBD8877024.1 flagellar hook-length control protein FliK [Roseibium polysiphoniae]